MYRSTLTSVVCLAALAIAGGARAESPTIQIGKSGQLQVEFSQCGSIVCAPVLKIGDSASKKPCEAKIKCGDTSLWGGLVANDGIDSRSAGLLKLDFLAEIGSKLIGDGFPLKTGPTKAKPAATKMKKSAPQPHLASKPNKPPTARIAKPEPTTAFQRVREATYN